MKKSFIQNIKKKCVGFDNLGSLLDFFYSLVSPIILYCSELWGVYLLFKDSDPYEHLHLKFIKDVLGVQYKSTNAAYRAELNRLHFKSENSMFRIKVLGTYTFIQ